MEFLKVKLSNASLISLIILLSLFLEHCHCYADTVNKNKFITKKNDFEKIYLIPLNVTEIIKENGEISIFEREALYLNELILKAFRNVFYNEKVSYSIYKDVNKKDLDSLMQAGGNNLFIILNISYIKEGKIVDKTKLAVSIILIAALAFGLAKASNSFNFSNLSINSPLENVIVEFYAMDSSKAIVKEKIYRGNIGHLRENVIMVVNSMLYEEEITYGME